jgi:hypothetical protein
VWIVEKKLVYHAMDLGFEHVEIPLRVSFQFEVKDGVFVPASLSFATLYNRKALENRYPRLNVNQLEQSIAATAENKIMKYLTESGFLRAKGLSKV